MPRRLVQDAGPVGVQTRRSKPRPAQLWRPYRVRAGGPAGIRLAVGLAMGTAALVALAIGGTGESGSPAARATAAPTALTSAPTVSRTSPPSVTRSPSTTRPAPVRSIPPTTPRRAATTASPTTVFQPPPTTYYRSAPTYYVATVPTTPAPTSTTTTTTIAPIGGRIPVPPSTLPLRTRTQSAHVSPVFAALSGAGFLVAFLIMAGRFILTRPGRKR